MKKKLIISVVTVLFGLSTLCSIALGAEEGGYHPSTFSVRGTIKAKDRHGISLMGGDYFVASYMTRVIIDDKPFRLSRLPVPCKAEIQYVINRKTHGRTATAIKVLEVPKGARSGWRRPVPE